MKRQPMFGVGRAAGHARAAPLAKRVAGGVLAAAAISRTARQARALSPGGALAATAVGATTVAGLGIRGGAAMLGFFVSSSLLSRLPHTLPLEQRRGNERDAIQVLANGGVASLLALASAVASPRTRPLFQAGFAGAVAAAAADTWATEIGSRSRQEPRPLVTREPVPAGAAGGVTWAGIAASAAGAAVIGGIAASGSKRHRWPGSSLPGAVILGGFSGALLDSLLGATVQEVRFCDACRRETELSVHDCGQATRPIRGARWCDNDTVNAIATAAGAGVTMAVSWLAYDQAEFDKA